jgi:hypothetical protein
LLHRLTPFLAQSRQEHTQRFVRCLWKLTLGRSTAIRVLTISEIWLCTATMVLMPGLSPIKVLV